MDQTAITMKCFSLDETNDSTSVSIPDSSTKIPQKKTEQNCHFPTKDETVSLENLEINLVYGCNLGCEYCAHFCRYVTGYESRDNIAAWSQNWNHKIVPYNLRLLGGEPLLHPELEQILVDMKRIWTASRLVLVTNGILLPTIRPSVIDTIHSTETFVYASHHFDDPDYNRLFFAGVTRLINSGIRHSIYTSHLGWRKYYHIHTPGQLRPYQSNPEKAWANCLTKNMCPVLIDNQIFRCQRFAHVNRNLEKGFLEHEWNVVKNYQPLTPEATPDEIKAHFAVDAPSACSICPEKYEYVAASEKRNGGQTQATVPLSY